MRNFLNVELRRVNEKRVDLILLLEDGSILHIEIQSVNDRRMKFRMGGYYYLVKETYEEVPVRQVVLYVGEPPMNMPDGFEADGNRLAYELIDIREFDAEALMATGNPADLALALLARGGKERLEEIVRRAAKLKGAARNRVLAQLLILAGLRGVVGRVEWLIGSMGMVIDGSKNEFLVRLHDEALAKGKAEGRIEGMSQVLQKLLRRKFGSLPAWAKSRLESATPVNLERWAGKVLTGSDLEDVLGKR